MLRIGQICANRVRLCVVHACVDFVKLPDPTGRDEYLVCAWRYNSDHQARICHSTTVTGVANIWGYGAMTNSYHDIRNAKTIQLMGGNPAEAQKVGITPRQENIPLTINANYLVGYILPATGRSGP
jgi:hypothetical protein